MAAAYAGPLKTAGYKLTRPALVIYAGTVATPCGQGLKGYPVFYCGSNETVYSSAGSTAEYGSTLRLGGYWIVFHEFGHHVQQRIGVLDAAYTRNENEQQISRRIELQADCFMGMTSISVRSAKLTAADRDEMTNWREQVPDKIHGHERLPALLGAPRVRHECLRPVFHVVGDQTPELRITNPFRPADRRCRFG